MKLSLLQSSSRCSLSLVLALAVVDLNAQEFVEPALPQGGPVQSGYFPTLVESALLRGSNDSRSSGGSFMEDGPDLARQIGSDIFPYQDAEPNFYQRNQDFFRPLDHVFGVLTPHDAVTYEFDQYDNTSLTLDARAGILTRTFSPDLATLKAGPLFFDLLWIGAGALYTDYQGPRVFAGADADGWAGYVDLAGRALLRLTDTIYLSVAANIIYLPWDNSVALRFGTGSDVGLLARVNYSETLGPWDLLLYNEFQGRPGMNWWGPGTVGNIDRAGRYYFGYANPGPYNEFYNDNFVIFSNRAGFNATRPVFGNQWRFAFAADHTDYWRGYSFANHQSLDHVGMWMGYEGSRIPFAPRFVYDMYSYDNYDSQWHRFLIQLTGRLTENLHWQGQVGYLATSGVRNGRDNFLWEVGLDHTLTRNMFHWIRIGESFVDNDLVAESLTSRFIRYGVDQRLGSRLWFRAFAQFADSETVIPSLQVRERFGAGAMLRYQPLDFTQFVASFTYDNIDQAPPQGDVDRWRYRIEAIQQLGHRLTGHIYYQYEDYEASPASFTEHLFGVTVRRYF